MTPDNLLDDDDPLEELEAEVVELEELEHELGAMVPLRVEPLAVVLLEPELELACWPKLFIREPTSSVGPIAFHSRLEGILGLGTYGLSIDSPDR